MARVSSNLPLWMDSYQARHGSLEASIHQKILSYSPRTLDRITAPHRSAGGGRLGRKTGRASNRIKKFVPIRCGPQAFDEPGWFEADTVSHGGGGSSGAFLWSLTLTDFHSGWTELATLWGNSGGEVRMGLERIEKPLPFPMLGFDCDYGSEETKYQLRATRATLDPMDLAADIEARLGKIFTIVERIEEDRQEEVERAGESHPLRAAAGADCGKPRQNHPKNQNQTKHRVS